MKTFAIDRLVVGIAGTGAMGRGIAQCASQAGCEVVLCDVQASAPQKAGDDISSMPGKRAEQRLPPQRTPGHLAHHPR